MIEVSIVSHAHAEIVDRVISHVLQLPDVCRVILTQNIPEATNFRGHPNVHIIENSSPKGFGANHNWAFRQVQTPYFCVLNPDIVFKKNPFPELLKCQLETQASIVAPMILNPQGTIEDSIRHFPTVLGLTKKLLGFSDGRYPFFPGQRPFFPDWVAGMFMLFPSCDFARLGGFDEQYFLYYEDVDICKRARRAGMQIAACPSATAIHDARRSSHSSFRYLRWHLASMMRYLYQSR